MNNKPILSVVTPTSGDISDYWLARLLEIKGDAEFILVYPPHTKIKEKDDKRIQ